MDDFTKQWRQNRELGIAICGVGIFGGEGGCFEGLPTLGAAAGVREGQQRKLQEMDRLRLGFCRGGGGGGVHIREVQKMKMKMKMTWGWDWDWGANKKTNFMGVYGNSIGNGNRVPSVESDLGIHHILRNESLGGDSQAAQIEAFLNRSKWVVSIVIGATIVWRHDAEALWAATGAVVNTALSITLKKLFNQQRPVSRLRSDPGMPSSHAQSFFYMLTLLNVSFMERWGINLFTAILFTMLFVVASYFSWLRVSQQFHTSEQVIAGAVVGSAFAILWFWWWYALVVHSFTSLLWVRIVVVVGATIYIFAFIHYIIDNSLFQSKYMMV
ncbi:lipid phosphate phosphatase epsilon 1, chloroplastic-like isoform X2 [Andrographis paniculata]|uniref:lipid phosphate phosphatase epsilon 1, chloroplastic-like isoform X2 n=1 Tax=Andrographis paniculata TaxID=175694 RepID=UPI0021E7D015|nr:lipid phosphate phosphatase epsilon 1, chloroplastic-like isoform X2 [Andrographis paniculata]